MVPVAGQVGVSRLNLFPAQQFIDKAHAGAWSRSSRSAGIGLSLIVGEVPSHSGERRRRRWRTSSRSVFRSRQRRERPCARPIGPNGETEHGSDFAEAQGVIRQYARNNLTQFGCRRESKCRQQCALYIFDAW